MAGHSFEEIRKKSKASVSLARSEKMKWAIQIAEFYLRSFVN
jgi:hypothetical protein